MNKDFAEFQKHFKHYQQLFGLTDYKVYCKHGPLDGVFAHITMARNDRMATVSLNSELPDKDKPFEDIKRSAKHEALHLLLDELEHMAKGRYLITEEEIDEASEGLIHKLEGLID